MIRYSHDKRTMGFIEELIGIGASLIGSIMASSNAEDAQRAAEKRRQAAIKEANAAAQEQYQREMEIWRAAKEATREQVALQRQAQQQNALKSAQMYRMIAVGGAIGLSVIGIGLLARKRR